METLRVVVSSPHLASPRGRGAHFALHAAILLAGLGLAACRGSDKPSTAACATTESGQLRCSIETLADCETVRDLPYARNLFCPAAFSAAQTMLQTVAASVGVKAPAAGFFHYYQTLPDPDDAPDDQSQTTVACLETRTPWGSRQVVGAGAPLCRLIAFVTSPGPIGRMPGDGGNPVPPELRAYPEYFIGLLPPRTGDLLADFQRGSAFDRRVRALGARARDRFLADDPDFAADALYDPSDWRLDPQYAGISGGGGGGWGGEIVVAPHDGEPRVLLAFGGGGGGGMTSSRSFGVTATRVGAGGGAGVQLADGYRVGERSYDGLGLGAGVGSEEDAVQYSYFDYEGSGRPPQPVHAHNPAVITEYTQQLDQLVAQLRTRLAAGESIVLRGGGGMGAGAEYLRENGEEHEPHALSTQAGFQFHYELGATAPVAGPTPQVAAEPAGAYETLGELYRKATAEAYRGCGRDYSNFACMCPATHANIVRLVREQLDDAAKVPAWLARRHCPSDA